MNGDADRKPSTVRRFGSFTELSVPLRTGRPKFDAADPPLDARAVDVAQELGARRLRRLPRAREAVAAAEQRARQRLAARDVREGEPAEEGRDLLVRRERLHDAGVPVTLQLHRRLAVRDQPGRARRALLRRRREEAVLERLARRAAAACTRPALIQHGSLEVVRDGRLLHRRLAAQLRREVVPVEGVRPAILAPDRDRRDSRRLQLADRRRGTAATSSAPTRCRPSRRAPCCTRTPRRRRCTGWRTACRRPASPRPSRRSS